MQRGSYESRAYAIFLLQSMLEIDDPMQLIGLRLELFIQLVQVLCDKISQHASKAKLKLMRRTCEIILTVLDEVCRCWEGPSELLNHGAGLTVVLKKILRVSRVANQRTVRIMWSISKFCATCNVLQEMVQLGIEAKLCLVLQVECVHRDGNPLPLNHAPFDAWAKEKAREVLKLHSRVWMNSPCIPSNMLSYYPA
ncbi:hypothetical protein V6N13_101197 [Hibiscus sabdariffa]